MEAKKGPLDYKEYVLENISSSNTFPRQDLAPIQFNIVSRQPYHVKVSDIQLVVELRVLKKTAAGVYAKMPEKEPVAPVNNFLYSAFKSIELLVNGLEIYSNPEYQLTTYLGALLKTPPSQRATTQATALFELDNPGEFIVTADDAITNIEYPKLHARQARIDQSEVVTLVGRLICAPLMSMDTLPEGLDFTIRMYPAPPNHCLHSSTAASEYSIEWLSARLVVPRVLPKANIGKQLYHYIHPTVFNFTHPKSVQTWGPKQILQGYMPTRLIIMFQPETTRLGSYRGNRLQFTPYDVQEIVLTVNGQEIPRTGAFKLKYTTEGGRLMNYDDIYISMFSELGEDIGTTSIPISREAFRNGFTLFPVNMMPGHPSDPDRHKPLYGSCSLEVKFRKAPLADNVTILVYAEYTKYFSVSQMIKQQRSLEVYPLSSRPTQKIK